MLTAEHHDGFALWNRCANQVNRHAKWDRIATWLATWGKLCAPKA